MPIEKPYIRPSLLRGGYVPLDYRDLQAQTIPLEGSLNASDISNTIGDNTVATQHIQDAAVTGVKIASSAVSWDKVKKTLIYDADNLFAAGGTLIVALEAGNTTADTVYVLQVTPSASTGVGVQTITATLGAEHTGIGATGTVVYLQDITGGGAGTVTVRLKVWKISNT